MKMKLPHRRIAEFCREWKIAEMALFGSVLRDDFRPDSDVDVLVTFEPDAHVSMFDVPAMQDGLAVILGRKVDVANRRAVEASENPFRKKAILSVATLIYPPDAAGAGPGHGAMLTAPGRTSAPVLDRDPGLLLDMLVAARSAREFSGEMSLDELTSDPLTISAVSRVLGEMGRAADKVSATLRERHPEICWMEMARFADRLLHEYREATAAEVWTYARRAAESIALIEPLIPTLDNETKSRGSDDT